MDQQYKQALLTVPSGFVNCESIFGRADFLADIANIARTGGVLGFVVIPNTLPCASCVTTPNADEHILRFLPYKTLIVHSEQSFT